MATVRELVTKWGFDIDEAPLKKMDQGIESLKTGLFAIGAAAGAAAGTLFGIAKATANAGDEARKSAMSVGVSTEAFQEMSFAAKLGGVEQEAFTGALQKLSRSAVEAGAGIATYADTYKKLGINVKTTDGKIKGSEQLLGEIADRFQKMPDGAEKTALAMELFGRTGAKLIPTLNAGSEGIGKLRQEAQDLGIVISEDTAAASEEMNDNIERLMSAFTGLRNILGAALIPLISELAVEFKDWILKNRELLKLNLQKFIEGLITFLKTFVAVTKQAIGIVNAVIESFGGWERVLKVVAIAMGAFLALKIVGAIGLITQGIIGVIGAFRAMGIAALVAQAKMLAIPLAIGAIVIAIGLLIEDVVAFFQGRDSLTGKILESFKETFPKLFGFLQAFFGAWVAYIKLIISGFQLLFSWIFKVGKVIGDFLAPIVETVFGALGKIGSFIGGLLGKGLDLATGALNQVSGALNTANAGDAALAVGGMNPMSSPVSPAMSTQNMNVSAKNTLNVNVQGLPPDVAERTAREAMESGFESVLRETSRVTRPQVER